ncbi:MAG: nucleotidyltransferase family protein [Chloroflexi bacterium]|nr:nucleotidyltransferase family protein [Chloroflexota bacterium]
MSRLTVSEQRLIHLMRIGFGIVEKPFELKPITDAAWAETVRLAEEHDVSAWLYFVLKDSDSITQIPLQVREHLRAAFLKRSVNLQLREAQLARLLPLLVQDGINPIFLKGAALAYTVYPNPICRGMGDLDLWVTADEMLRAQAILEAMGYQWRDKSDRPFEIQKRLGGEVQLFGGNMIDGMIELHWSAFPGEWMWRTAHVDEEGIRNRARRGQLGPQSVLVFSPEDTLIQLAAHFAISHQLGSPWLRALLDMALLIQMNTIQWNWVIQRAHSWRLASMMYLVLSLLHELIGQPSKQILNQLSPVLPHRAIIERMANLASVAKKRDIRGGPRRFLFLLLIIDRWQDVLRLLGRALWPESEWLQARYGRSGLGVQLQHLAHAAVGRI